MAWLDSSLQVVSTEAWLSCALFLTIRFYLAGAAWNWLLPAALLDQVSRRASAAFHASAALLMGVPCSLLTSLALAEWGKASLKGEMLGSMVMLVGGVLVGLVKARHRVKPSLTSSWPGALAVFLGVAVIMNLPRCGEWIVGGWDPGVYMNEGVCVGRSGTFHPAPMAHHEQLAREELPLFNRGQGVFMQSFPAVPLDPEGRQIRHYFFRLTPTLISVLARCGGLGAATRVNVIMGFLGLFVLAAFLWVHRWPPVSIVIALLLCVSHPLWLYHLHLPTSEMMELFLVLGLGVALALRRTGGYGCALFSLLALSAVLNRVSFVPFAGMMIMAIAWADLERTDRRRVNRERLLQVLTIAAGAVYDFTVTGVTMASLRYAVPELLIVTGVTLTLAMALDSLAARGMCRWLMSPTLVFGALLGLVVAVGLGAWLLGPHVSLFARVRQNAVQIGPYLGTGLLLLSIPGAVVLWWGPVRTSRCFAAMLMVLTGITALLMVNNFVVPVCPWATRRYLPFTLPLLVIAASSALSAVWHATVATKVLRGALVVAVLGVVLAGTARLSWHALRGTEYDGLSVRLAEVAQQIGPRDLVVSDHFKWGTPLLLLHGKHVLDGSKFYGKGGAAVMEEGITALARLKGSGWRVLFLTSTSSGLEVYPRAIPDAVPVWSASPFTVKEIIHSARARDFELREKTVVFTLYALP